MPKIYLDVKSNFVFLSLCIVFLCGREKKQIRFIYYFFAPAQEKKIRSSHILFNHIFYL